MKSQSLLTTSLSVWWPQDTAAILPLLDTITFLRIMQVNAELAESLGRYAFRRKPFHTSLLDLSQTPEALWKAMDKKSCRYDINKARKIEHDIVVNNRYHDALQLLNQFIGRSGYRKSLSRREWATTLQYSDVFTAFHNNVAVATHVVLIDQSSRARLLFSATADRADESIRDIVGPLNKALHWFELNHYRERGVGCYDFGGIVLEANSPLYSISRAKQGFGGQTVTEHILYLTRHPSIRRLAGSALRIRQDLRRLMKLGS